MTYNKGGLLRLHGAAGCYVLVLVLALASPFECVYLQYSTTHDAIVRQVWCCAHYHLHFGLCRLFVDNASAS